MIKKLTFIVVILGMLLGAGVLFLWNQPIPEILQNNSLRPWIEVIAPKIIDLQSKKERELKTGDTLEIGTKILPDKNGFATIYFPDGSLLRADKETIFTIEYAGYLPGEKKLTVRIMLETGKIWSKVLALTTHDSSWEVKTSNAVATVRGTAFNVEVRGDQTIITGSEGKIYVSAKDPKSNTPVPKTEVIIESGKFIEITDANIPSLKKDPTALRALDVPKEFLNDPWILKNSSLDAKHQLRLKSLPDSPIKGILLREKIFENKKKDSPALPRSPLPIPRRMFIPTPQPILRQEVLPKELQVIPTTSLDQVAINQLITFDAVLEMSDGTNRNVTNGAEWFVGGPIGEIQRPGVLLIRPPDFKPGTYSGNVIARWQDPSRNGQIFSSQGPTIIIKIESISTQDEKPPSISAEEPIQEPMPPPAQFKTLDIEQRSTDQPR